MFLMSAALCGTLHKAEVATAIKLIMPGLVPGFFVWLMGLDH
jgi:hypothetical protein